MTSPRVTFVVPSLKPISEATLRRRLKLAKASDHELINACGDRSAAANRNAGIKRSRGENIIFVDDDVEAVLPDWWHSLLDALERRSQIVCCAPLLWIPGKGLKELGKGRVSADIDGGWNGNRNTWAQSSLNRLNPAAG
jgi:glycosyltransferase involved in cell wall biosynthesis